jgi:hypothetical protein
MYVTAFNNLLLLNRHWQRKTQVKRDFWMRERLLMKVQTWFTMF